MNKVQFNCDPIPLSKDLEKLKRKFVICDDRIYTLVQDSTDLIMIRH